jgi:hypothetical protein
VNEVEVGVAVERMRASDGSSVLSIPLDDLAVENIARKDGALTGVTHSYAAADRGALS